MMKFIKNILFSALFILLCSGCIITGRGYQMYQEAVEETGLAEMADSIRSRETFTEYEELPEDYVKAVVAVEDKRFFSHNGVDLIAIGRALVNDMRAGTLIEGGSTITQQLAKNLYFTGEKELTRKIAEVFMALAMEDTFTKEEIFELYVNSINFGDGYYDVASASRGYFGKEPEDMNQYESTLLAGIPNAPARYAPTKNPKLAAQRQLQVVRRMAACGYLSVEDAEEVAETVAETLAELASE